MVRVPNEDSAAQRARWLAEVADALEDARRVVKILGAAEGRIDAVGLYARIEAVRLQVQSMRIRRSYGGSGNSRPEWTNGIPWKESA